MRLKTKLFFITLLPFVLVTAAMSFFVEFQSERLSHTQSKTIESLFLSIKRTELKNYVTLARNALQPIYSSKLKTKRQAQRQVKEIVRKMNFGEDSYFYIYEEDGTNIVNPHLTYLVGSNWIGLEDVDGKPVVRDLIDRAKDGGEFYSYIWKKPSSGAYVEKLGYSVFLDNWKWMIGTGIYLDDVLDQVSKVQAELKNNVSETRLVLFVLMFAGMLLTAIIISIARLSEQRFADARLKELSARQVDFQEEERKRVSRELHDSISQLLVSARYGLETALSKSSGTSQIGEPIGKSMKALDEAITEVRRISMALRPSVLDDMGLAAALKSLGTEFSQQSNIKVEVDAQQVRQTLSDEAKTALYRITQEALTNVARHSQAKNVRIRLHRNGNKVVFELSDDGTGMARGSETQDRGGGLGIRNMKERIDTLQGSIRFSKAASGGLAIRVVLPVVKQKK